MRKPKLQIIVLFQNLGDRQAYYARSPAPPLSGLLLAAETPPLVEVEVLHEMVRPVDYETDADFIALSFMDFCAPHAYDVARRFRARGKVVIAGGKYPSTFPQEVIPHFDCVVVGEAERVWPKVVEDLVAGEYRKVYRAPLSPSLENIPPPRYDLAEPQFAMPVVTEATRGCPFHCSFCQLNVKRATYRTRPVADVIADLKATDRLPLRKRKMAMILDNNLCGDLDYAKELLREVAKLKLWAVGVQFSFNYLRDKEFMDLLEAANCRMAFIGLESLHEASLKSVDKTHNRVEEYEQHFAELKRRGILTFTGIILALDEDTPEYYSDLPRQLERVDPSAILVSVAIPIPGTPLHRQMHAEDRIFDEDLSHYEGDHLVFHPKRVTPDEVYEAAREVNRQFYAWSSVVRRWWRFMKAFLRNSENEHRLLGALVTTVILFKLSVFQRHHAKERVYGNTSRIPTRPKARAADQPAVLPRGTRTAEMARPEKTEPRESGQVVRPAATSSNGRSADKRGARTVPASATIHQPTAAASGRTTS